MLPIARIDYCSIALSFMCIFNGIHCHSTHFVYAYPKKKKTQMNKKANKKFQFRCFPPIGTAAMDKKALTPRTEMNCIRYFRAFLHTADLDLLKCRTYFFIQLARSWLKRIAAVAAVQQQQQKQQQNTQTDNSFQMYRMCWKNTRNMEFESKSKEILPWLRWSRR